MLLLHTVQSALLYPGCIVLSTDLDKISSSTIVRIKVICSVYDQYKVSFQSSGTIHVYPTWKCILCRPIYKQKVSCLVYVSFIEFLFEILSVSYITV